jgi:hypothetical protein
MRRVRQHTPARRQEMERRQSGVQMRKGANSTICVSYAIRVTAKVFRSERDEAINTNGKSVEICLCAFTRCTSTGLKGYTLVGHNMELFSMAKTADRRGLKDIRRAF